MEGTNLSPCCIPTEDGETPMMNGEANGEAEEGTSKHDIIIITGNKDKCEAAKNALLVSMENMDGLIGS